MISAHSFAALLSGVVLFLAHTAHTSAQTFDTTGRVHRAMVSHDIVFPDWLTSADELFFSSAAVGYYGNARTTDSGITWREIPAPAPIPHTMVDTLFGYSPGGLVTYNGGITWQGIVPAGLDSSAIFIVDMVASSAQQFSVLYTMRDGALEVTRPYRLAITSDGGSSWQFPDSVASIALGTLTDSSLFGLFPRPFGLTDAKYKWLYLVRPFTPDTGKIRAVIIVSGELAGMPKLQMYLGSLDPRTRSARWDTLPFYGFNPYYGLARQALHPEYEKINFVSPDTAYTLGLARRILGSTTVTYPDIVWRSVDAGRSWDSVGELPDNFLPIELTADRLLQRVFFLSPLTIVSPPYRSDDGSQSWKHWCYPYAPGTLAPVDSSLYYLANSTVFFARTTDAGHSWYGRSRLGRFRSAAVHKGNILLGRDQGLFHISQDSGATWRNAGMQGALPAGYSEMLGLAFIDPLADPGRVIGVARFTMYNCVNSTHVVESNDSGATWNLGAHIPSHDNVEQRITIRSIPNADLAGSTIYIDGPVLLASENDGLSWEVRSNDSILRTAPVGTDTRHLVASGIDPATTAENLYISSDGGRSWQKTYTPDSLFARVLSEIHMFDSNHVRAVYKLTAEEWYVLASSDGGQSWEQRRSSGTGGRVTDAIYWIDTVRLYAVSDGESLYYSMNGGASFDRVITGLPSWVSGRSGDQLYFTNGTDIVRWNMFPLPPLAQRSVDRNATLNLELLGNPIHGGRLRLRITLEHVRQAVVSVSDELGRIVAHRDIESVDKGSSEVWLDLGRVAAGHYIVTLKAGGSTISVPLVVVR